jgi:predicted flavoprotein YhiN
VLALGGGSWARLGSDGRWVDRLVEQGVSVEPLRPSNCGFDVAGATGQGWSDFFWQRHAGQPLKSVALSFVDSQGKRFARKGEFVATRSGVEGSLIYAVSALLREEIARSGSATPLLDLLPDRTLEEVSAEVARPRGSRSMASHLKSRLRLDGIKSSLLHELLDRSAWHDPQQLARVRLGEGVDTELRLRAHTLDASAVFCAGEMLDWEAPTGGYLLTACLASGHWAGRNALSQWRRRSTMEG